MSANRIEKTVVLHAPRNRVWRAISNSQTFGAWFGVAFPAPFAEGERLVGRVTPTRVDSEVAAMQRAHEGAAFEIVVERIDPEQRFSFRWHPFAIDPAVDYSREPATLVAFDLEDSPEGARLTISETGFDDIAAERREQAYAANEGGWEMQTKLIAKYLALRPRD